MKILIAYHSDTGNTEKVAMSMKEALEEEGQDVTIAPAKNIDFSDLKSYDLACFGSGVYAGGVGKSIQAIVKKATEFPPKIVLFCTHMRDKVDPKFFNKLKKTIEEFGSNVIGEFECPGEDKGLPPDFKEKMLSTIPHDKKAQAEKWFVELKGRPNDEDLEKVKEFAKSLLK